LIPFSIRDIEKALEIWPKIFEIFPLTRAVAKAACLHEACLR